MTEVSSADDDYLKSVDIDKVDFFSPAILANPAALFARLRKERPVARYFHPVFGCDEYVVTSYALVEEAFRDSKRFSSNFLEMMTGGGKGNPEATAILAKAWQDVNTVLTADEPDHTRLRALVAKAFMPNRIKRMSDLITVVVDKLIDGFIERGECNFIKEYSVPLPIYSVSAALGIPEQYQERIYNWTLALVRRIGQMGTDEEQVADAHQIVELKEFILALVRDREKEPRDDLVSDLVTARVDGQNPLTELEVLSTVQLLILGGAETARNTLTFAMARLMLNPTQLQLLRNDPSLTSKVIEETLRYDSPGAASWRVATCDTELGSVKIPKGAMIMLRMDSAARDETVFEKPEEFDLQRTDVNNHLGFGRGIHYCVGFRFAREQVNQSVQALLSRLNGVRINAEKSDLRVNPSSSHVRSPLALHLVFEPGKVLGPR
jgi:cytochrome P450